jgi:ferredoxin/flavodoxin---NADP+ reductase
MESGKLFADLGLPALNPETDRVMLCGSPQMLKSLKTLLEERHFKEGNTTTPRRLCGGAGFRRAVSLKPVQ